MTVMISKEFCKLLIHTLKKVEKNTTSTMCKYNYGIYKFNLFIYVLIYLFIHFQNKQVFFTECQKSTFNLDSVLMCFTICTNNINAVYEWFVCANKLVTVVGLGLPLFSIYKGTILSVIIQTWRSLNVFLSVSSALCPALCPHCCTYETDRDSLCQPPCLELCQTQPCLAPLLC